MKKILIFSVVLTIAGSFACHIASAQIPWTPAQRAVWETETTMDSLFMQGDYQAVWSYIDDSYQGWRNDFAMPRSKDARIKLSKYYISQGGKALFSESTPVAIWVKGDYAYVDYYYNLTGEYKSGKKFQEHGRWMDVLMKEHGKWMLVGDHGGADPDPETP